MLGAVEARGLYEDSDERCPMRRGEGVDGGWKKGNQVSRCANGMVANRRFGPSTAAAIGAKVWGHRF